MDDWGLTSKSKLWAAGQNITNRFPASFLRQSICTKYGLLVIHSITRVTEANNPWFMHVICNSHHRSCTNCKKSPTHYFFLSFLAIKEDYLEKLGRCGRLNILTKSWNRQFKLIIHKFGRVNYEMRGSCSYRGMHAALPRRLVWVLPNHLELGPEILRNNQGSSIPSLSAVCKMYCLTWINTR